MATPVTRHIHVPPNPNPGAVGNAIGGVRDTVAQALNKAQAFSVQVRAKLYNLSYEVPFDRWFYHYGLEQPLTDAEASNKIQAHVWALVALAESLVRGLAAVVQYCFAKVFNSAPVDDSLNLLCAQWDSIRLSANAIISPEETIRAATTPDEGGQLPIGRLLKGTPYPPSS